MNLAEQVRQLREIRTTYNRAFIDRDLELDLELVLKHAVTHTTETEVYFLDMKDYHELSDFSDYIDWFSWIDSSHFDAEKIAKKHGFTTELVELEGVLGFELEYPIKALKITWGA